MSSPAATRPDPANIQGLILRGYTHPYSCHLLFKLTQPAATSAGFFKALYPSVTSGSDWGETPPEVLLNIALTFPGILALEAVSRDDAEKNFPIEFQTDPGQNPQDLGDLGPSAPANWWNKRFHTRDIHCIVHVHALHAETLAQRVDELVAVGAEFGVQELLPLSSGSGRLEGFQDPDGIVHFGYRDGIANPKLDWPTPGTPSDPGDLNNFLIGYGEGSQSDPAPTQGASLQFAKDGCYVAFRVLHQEVAAFERFLKQQGEEVAGRLGLAPAQASEWIAAKLMGRWRNGSPLVLSPNGPEDSTRNADTFGYWTGDQQGRRCPFSAHIRVTNPRDQPLEKDEPSSQSPRLLRRGMPYGPFLTSGEEDGKDRGLIGLFLCGSLARQFMQVMNWINQNNFSQVFSPGFNTQDGVLGNRRTAGIQNSFLIPNEGGDIQFPKLQEFVITRGTAYTLLPSMATLRSLAGL